MTAEESILAVKRGAIGAGLAGDLGVATVRQWAAIANPNEAKPAAVIQQREAAIKRARVKVFRAT